MQSQLTRMAGRTAHIVRAASVEVALPEPPPSPEPPPPAPLPPPALPPAPVAVVAPPAENKDAQALREIVRTLSKQVEEWRSHRQRTIDDVARLSIELGVALAERLLSTETAANRQRLDRIVQQALKRLPTGSSVSVTAHPDDIALLEKQLDSEENKAVPRADLTFRPDAATARGQVRLDAGEFFVEWDPATALKEMRAALLEEALS